MSCEPTVEEITPKLLDLAVRAAAERTRKSGRVLMQPPLPLVSVRAMETAVALGVRVDTEDGHDDPYVHIAHKAIEAAVNGDITLVVADNEFMFRCFGSQAYALAESLTLTIPRFTYAMRVNRNMQEKETQYRLAIGDPSRLACIPETKFTLHLPMTLNKSVTPSDSMTTLLGMTKKLERTLYLLQTQINAVYFQTLFQVEKNLGGC